MSILLSTLEGKTQNRLRNVVNSVIDQDMRVSAYNDAIDFLQSKANWNFTKRVAVFDYLAGEADYSLANDLGISDFKQYKEIRFLDSSLTKEFEEVSGEKLSLFRAQGVRNNLITFEDRDNDTILRILTNNGKGNTMVDDMEDLTTGRTWASDTTNSDATTLAEDDIRANSGSSSLKFNIDVSQSGNNKATIYTSTSFTTAFDFGELLNIGVARLSLDLKSLTDAQLALISSVDFIWGSDSSVTPATKANYWSASATTTVNGGSFMQAWNRLNFEWENATKTGSPDESAIKYFEITVNFGAGMTDANNIRIDTVQFFEPQEMELVYYSTSFVNNAGTWQEHFTTTVVDANESLLLPTRHINLFINKVLMDLFPQKEKNNEDYLRVKSETTEALALAIQQDGNPITRENNEFQVDGYSSGRDDISGDQW